MKRHVIEIGVGLFFILAVLSFVVLAFKASGLSGAFAHKTYTVTANFETVGGLRVRAPVMIAGVKIGEVKDITLNQTTFMATVTMDIYNSNSVIPDDSSASIFTAGLIGANYVSIGPGYASTFLKEGSVITTTHPALVLENLISQLLFNVKK